MSAARSREVDAHGNCSRCGGVHYGTGWFCVYTPEELEAQEQGVVTMERYIGTKIILAEPAMESTIQAYKMKEGQEDRPGYKVVYEDGYISWSPKETFERAYRLVTPNELSLLGADRRIPFA